MEILFFIAIGAAVIYLGYKALNKESETGRHPLDSITPKEEAPYKVETPVVNTKTGEPVSPQITDAVTQTPAWHTAPAEGTKLAENVLDVNHDGKVNLEDVKEVVKKTRARVKKVADVDGDGKVTKQDVNYAAKRVKEKATKKVAVIKAKTKSKKA